MTKARRDPLQMARKRGMADHVVELMASLGPVVARPMFGGFGLFLDGLMFGLIARDVLYFKVDEQSDEVFASRRLPRFTYESAGKTTALWYREAPAEVHDDAAEMTAWARLGFDCAVRQRGRKSGKSARATGGL